MATKLNFAHVRDACRFISYSTLSQLLSNVIRKNRRLLLGRRRALDKLRLNERFSPKID